MNQRGSEYWKSQGREHWAKMSRADRLCNGRLLGVDWPHGSDTCNNGQPHDWQPVSFVFETQLLDGQGRVMIRQPDLRKANVYCVCMGCRTHTYVETEWAGYYLGGPGGGPAGPDPVLSLWAEDDAEDPEDEEGKPVLLDVSRDPQQHPRDEGGRYVQGGSE